MKKTKRKIFLHILIALSIIALGILGVNLLQKSNNAYASTVESNESGEAVDDFVILSNENNVPATYEYVVLNDTECAVKITNKSVATKAIIPSYVELEGTRYAVTEVVSNGFTSAPLLERVSLPYTIKKLGNYAFANCKKLERVNLANVEQIGNNVFYRCPELKELILPKSVNYIGSNILSGNNTQVKARAEVVGVDWHANWNVNNQNQTVEFNCKTVQPLELEPVYETATRSTENNVIGYELAGGQPRTDEFYVTKENADISTDTDDLNNIFIPKEFNGKEIVGIANDAFEGSSFNQLIVEYSEKALKIGTSSFAGTTGTNITFNRSIEFWDRDLSVESNNVFSFSSIESIVLPNSITNFADQMFSCCEILKNIYFIEPKDNLSRRDLLSIVDVQASVAEQGVIHLPASSALSYIGDSAFQGTASISKLHLNDSIEYIGQWALDDWNNETQKVFIHNTKKIVGWHKKWNSAFTNIEYDKTFYTIAFNADGGTISELTKDVEFNTAIGEMSVPIKSGLVFMGWYLDNVNYNSSTVYSIESDVELIAHWGYTITLDKIGGVGGSDFVYAEYNNPMPDAVKPERRGYDFKGYYTSLDGEGIRYYDEYMSGCRLWDKEQNFTLYADWAEKQIEVRFEKEGGENGSNYVFATFGKDMPEAVAPQKINNIFMGYFTEPNGNGDMYYDADMQSKRKCEKIEKFSLYACWSQLYTIKFNRNGGAGGTDCVQVVFGQELPVAVAPTLDHSDFMGYYLDGDENPYYNADMTSNRTMDKEQDITLYAKYAPIKYAITYDLNDTFYLPATNNSLNKSSITYYDAVTLYEPSREHFAFDGWYLNGMYVITLAEIDSDITLTANWVGIGEAPTPNETNYYDSPYVNLVFKKLIANVSYRINIGPNVKELFIYAASRKADITMSIVVMDKRVGLDGLMEVKRNSDLKLMLSNISIKAVSGSHAVIMDSEKTLHLYSDNSSITGSDTLLPSNASLKPSQGSSAIYCRNLTIHTSAYLKGGSRYQSTEAFTGGVGVSLAEGGTLKISSNDVRIIGGDSMGLINNVRGLPFYAKNNNYTLIVAEGIIFNRTEYGLGNVSTTQPFIGY